MTEQHVCAEIVPIFNHLDRDSLIKISAITQYRQYHKGELIFAPHLKPKLLILARGQIKEYQLSATGKEQLLRVYEAGSVLGENALLESGPSENFAEALTDIEVCLISGEEFRALLLEYPLISLKLLEEYNRRLRQSDEQTLRIATSSAAARLASYLLDLAKAEDSATVTLPFSMRELAKFLAIAPETLSRRLRSFTEEGFITRKAKTIKIHDRRAFEEHLLELQDE